MCPERCNHVTSNASVGPRKANKEKQRKMEHQKWAGAKGPLDNLLFLLAFPAFPPPVFLQSVLSELSLGTPSGCTLERTSQQPPTSQGPVAHVFQAHHHGVDKPGGLIDTHIKKEHPDECCNSCQDVMEVYDKHKYAFINPCTLGEYSTRTLWITWYRRHLCILMPLAVPRVVFGLVLHSKYLAEYIVSAFQRAPLRNVSN